MKFAENLNEYLDSHDISNYRIYKDTGLSDSLIGYWRKGQKQPTLENLVILCDYLNVSIDYLVGNISAKEEKLLHYYRCLSPEKKDEIDTYMNNSAIDT